MKKFRLLTAVAMALLLVAALAGCGKAPAGETIDKAIANSKEIKTQHVDFDASLSVKGSVALMGTELKGPITITMKGGADIDTRGAKPKAKGSINLGGLDQLLQGLSTTPEGQMGASLIGGALSNIEFVLLEENLYVKIAGAWYDMGDALAGMLSMEGGQDVQSDCFSNALRDTSRFSAENSLKDVQELSGEQINGSDTRHFSATVDLDKVLTELANVSRECGQPEAAGGLEAARAQITQTFKKLNLDIWIDGDDNFRQVKVDMEVDPSIISVGGGAAGSSPVQSTEPIALVATAKFSSFGEDFQITKPAGEIISIEKLLGESLGGLGLEGLGGTATVPTP